MESGISSLYSKSLTDIHLVETNKFYKPIFLVPNQSLQNVKKVLQKKA